MNDTTRFPLPKYVSTPVDKLTDEKQYIIVLHSDLFKFLTLGYFKLEYPYPLEVSEDRYRELLFYAIADRDNIAEVGAGNSWFGFSLADIYDSLYLALNEIDSSKIHAVNTKLNFSRDLFPDDAISIVGGTTLVTNLDPRMYNKILLRNTLHHFTDPEAMLESIRLNLKPGGILYIYEIPGDQVQCSHAKSKRHITRLVNRNGFTVVSKVILNKGYLLKCWASKE